MARSPSSAGVNTDGIDGTDTTLPQGLRTGDRVASTRFTTQGDESRTAERSGDSRMTPSNATQSYNNESAASSTPARSHRSPEQRAGSSAISVDTLRQQLLSEQPQRTPLAIDKAVLLILLGRQQTPAEIIEFMGTIVDEDAAIRFISESSTRSCDIERYAYQHCDRREPSCPWTVLPTSAGNSYEEYVPPPSRGGKRVGGL